MMLLQMYTSRRFFIDYPYRPYMRGELARSAGGICVTRFPGQNADYSFQETLDILELLNARWTDAGCWPPPLLEPRAVEAVTLRLVPPLAFTFHEYCLEVGMLPYGWQPVISDDDVEVQETTVWLPPRTLQLSTAGKTVCGSG